MSRTILIKHHPCIQLAHLYEHLYCDALKHHLYSHGLYKYIDFSLMGVTYEPSGIIEISIEGFTPTAQEIIDKAALQVPVPLDAMSIGIALQQILAEEKFLLYTSDTDTVYRQLHTLHALPWKNIDTVTFIDTKASRSRRLPIYLTNMPAKVHDIHLSIGIDVLFSRTNRHLLPLFYYLSRIILVTLADHASMEYGHYQHSDIEFSEHRVNSSLRSSAKLQQDVTAAQYMGIATETARNLLQQEHVERIMSRLKNISYWKDYIQSPDEEIAIRAAGIYIGSRGWQNITSQNVIIDICQHADISIKVGRKKLTQPILAGK
jgi:hypothetical protein